MKNGDPMPQDQPISKILDYPVDGEGKLVTRRAGLSRMKPRLNAPPATQPGSVHWTMMILFGDDTRAIEMIESLVAGQGNQADEKWVQFCLLYRKWQQDYKSGELVETPNFNQVCHSLDFDAKDFISQLQVGIQGMMKTIAHTKLALSTPRVINNLIDKASSDEADAKIIELHLKTAGITESSGGINVNVNQHNTSVVMTKGEKELMKTPLRQFSSTLDDIDEEVRKDDILDGELVE